MLTRLPCDTPLGALPPRMQASGMLGGAREAAGSVHACRGSWLTSARQCARLTALTAVARSSPVLGRCGPWHRSTCMLIKGFGSRTPA